MGWWWVRWLSVWLSETADSVAVLSRKGLSQHLSPLSCGGRVTLHGSSRMQASRAFQEFEMEQLVDCDGERPAGRQAARQRWKERQCVQLCVFSPILKLPGCIRVTVTTSHSHLLQQLSLALSAGRLPYRTRSTSTDNDVHSSSPSLSSEQYTACSTSSTPLTTPAAYPLA